MKKANFILILYMSISTFTYGQQISGVLRDSVTLKAVEYVLVKILPHNGEVVDGTISDSIGNFHLGKIPEQGFYIEFQCLGYQSKLMKFETIPKSESMYLTVLLARDDILLDEVVITADRPLISLKADKRVLNINSSISSAGETAAEVLQLLPEIKVENNQVTLKSNHTANPVSPRFRKLVSFVPQKAYVDIRQIQAHLHPLRIQRDASP